MIDYLPEDKIAYVILILKGIEGINISEEDPDELDLLLIRDATIDNKALVNGKNAFWNKTDTIF